MTVAGRDRCHPGQGHCAGGVGVATRLVTELAVAVVAERVERTVEDRVAHAAAGGDLRDVGEYRDRRPRREPDHGDRGAARLRLAVAELAVAARPPACDGI